MSDTHNQSGGLIGLLTRTFLLIALILTLAGTYIAFFILPKELPERQTIEDMTGLPAKYGDQPSVFSSATTVTTEGPAAFDFKPLDWRAMAHIEREDSAAPDIIITATDLNDRLLAVDYFSASIVLASDDKRTLANIEFKEEQPGRFVAKSVSIPGEGDWEIRATVRRGLQTILIGQKIGPLFPVKPR